MSESKRLLLLGSGGHCMSVLDSILTTSDYREIGLVDSKPLLAENPIAAMNIPILGNDEDLEGLHKDGFQYAFVAVGSIGNVSVRRHLYTLIKKIGFMIPNIIDSSSVVSHYVKLGEGIYVGKKAVINAGTYIGNCAIVNTSAIVEHTCRIGDFAHLSPGSIVCGNVIVGNNTHIGAGSAVKQGVHLGDNTLIGMGSTVLKDISSCVLAYGSPCKEVGNE